jgi:hypothetical protein
MSVVINYVAKYLLIIITDNRISYGKNAEYGWEDLIWDGQLAWD